MNKQYATFESLC